MTKIQNDVTSNHVVHRLLPSKKGACETISRCICCRNSFAVFLMQTEASVRQI